MSEKNPIRDMMPVEIDKLYGGLDGMRAFQRWWYMSLLFRAWQNDEMPCHLPADWDSLWTVAGASTLEEWRKHSTIVRRKFSETGDGQWIFNAPQLERYQEKMALYQKRVEAGRSGGKKRASNAQAMLKHDQAQQSYSCSLNTNTEQESKTNLPELKYEFNLEPFDGEELFIRLCDAHPKPEENVLASSLFLECCEWAMQRKGFKTRTESALWIIERAKRYRDIAEFKHGLINWLDKKIFNQADSAWKSTSPKIVDASKFYDEHGNSRFAKSGLQK